MLSTSVDYPFNTLPENLASFCALLRRDHRFRIGPRELMDAARGLAAADLANERQVRDVLRPILSKTCDDARQFDAAFDRFFHARGAKLPPDAAGEELEAPGRGPADTRESRSEARSSPSAETAPASLERAGGPPVREVTEEETEAEDDRAVGPTLLRASYSPLEAEGEPVAIDPPTRDWLDAAAVLVTRVRAVTSRRWRPALRGPRFDFRRTLRSSLHTGGDAVTPKWRARSRRSPRFVILIDGSRSMGASARPALRAAVALSAAAGNTETFAFSTSLRRVTRDVRGAAAGERRTLDLRHAWGGGTTIGACLRDFVLHHSERLLGHGTVLIVASDGLDVGEPDLLRDSMAALARRAAAIVWVNPFLSVPGYEPTAAGMRIARPFVTLMATVNRPEDLRSLARNLKIR